jgi:hypothetical protein
VAPAAVPAHLIGSGLQPFCWPKALTRTWWCWAVHRPDDPTAYARKVLVNRRRSLLRRAGGDNGPVVVLRPKRRAADTAVLVHTAVLSLAQYPGDRAGP